MPQFSNFPLTSILIAALIFAATVVIIFFLLKIKKLLSDTQTNCFEDAYKLLPNAVIVLNDDNVIYINPVAEQMLGNKLRSVMGRSYRDVFDLKHLKTRRSLQGLTETDSAGDNELISCECLLQTSTNQTLSVELNISPLAVYDNGINQSYTLMVLTNITERKAIESKLSDLEKHDTLTRMLNRKSFDAAVKQLIDNSYKHDAKHVLAYFSIDQFQAINEAVGYSGGDVLIVKTGELIRRHLKKELDIIGRVGGSEFAVIFRETNLASAIKKINEILVDAQETSFAYRGRERTITLSAGFVVVDVDSTSSTRVITEANLACNQAKKHGGNNLSAYKPKANDIQKLDGDIDWMVLLREAMQQNQFQIYAQPIHSLDKNEYGKPFHHYELLLRLFGVDGKPIYPDEFISAAEYYSMMPMLDRWVVRNVLQQLKGVPAQTPLPVFAINLSGQSLNDPRFLDFVLKEVKDSNVDPQMLCFEITEQVAVEDMSLVNRFIEELKALGSAFSLDDFGTGMSSYGYLRSLDVDYLKIDGSFVKNIVDDDVARAMVQSINQVGHTMNLKVIAEYVENTKILTLLREMGVDYGQGYHILRPTPLEEMLKQHLTPNGIESSSGDTIKML